MAEDQKDAKYEQAQDADPSGSCEVSEEGSVSVVAVEHPGEDANEEFLRNQDEAYLRYRVTGEVGDYIDPLRDQEPDIAPEFGVAPHPELANPRAPEGFFTGVNLDPDANPVVRPFEEKEENSRNLVEETQEGAEEAKKAAEAERKAAEKNGVAPGESITVTAAEEGQFAGRVADESPKAAAGNVRAQG